MSIARHGSGPVATGRALASQVHPVFMLPPLAASWFGALLTPELDIVIGTVHVLAMFCAVYTAHVKDGYVDFYFRGEDDDHPMTERGCKIGLAGATTGFALCLVYLGVAVGPGAALVTLPTWFIGYLHAPQLDTNPVTATMGYPTGIALAILGGQYVQSGVLAADAVAFALVFLVTLTGVKIIDDAKDFDYDRSIDKHTVAVVLGPHRARELAYGLMILGMVAVVWFAVDGTIPPSAPVATLGFGAVAIISRRAGPKLATMLLVRGAYVFLALLLVSVWFRPAEALGLGLPDIGVLGPYTYLATEVVFGSLALALLVRAGALWRAARTITVLYPLAYVWDWYTLAVGVFAIPLRTGIELFGIPIEEHLFMFVVPALVIGIHETIQPSGEPTPQTEGTVSESVPPPDADAGSESD